MGNRRICLVPFYLYKQTNSVFSATVVDSFALISEGNSVVPLVLDNDGDIYVSAWPCGIS